MDLVTHIFECLDELNEAAENDFVMGEKYAYIECLEILLQDKGIKNETMLALEKKIRNKIEYIPYKYAAGCLASGVDHD